jgi:hypothetical protein
VLPFQGADRLEPVDRWERFREGIKTDRRSLESGNARRKKMQTDREQEASLIPVRVDRQGFNGRGYGGL